MAYLTPWTVPDNFNVDESEPEADAHLILNIEKSWADVVRIIAEVETKLPTPAWEIEINLPKGHVFDDYSATNCNVVSYDEASGVLRFKNTPWNGPLTANLTQSFGYQCHGVNEEEGIVLPESARLYYPKSKTYKGMRMSLVSEDGEVIETKDRKSE